MENTNRDTVYDAAPQYDWQNTDAKADRTIIEDNEEYTIYEMLDENNEPIYAQQHIEDPDPKEEEDEEEDDDNDDNEEKDQEGDWGHVDPAESKGPFPSSNEPSGPGSAV